MYLYSLFVLRGNITVYVLCSSNQSHSNITTLQEIQSLLTKQMKICQERISCLTKRKSFITEDTASSKQHIYAPVQSKNTLPELLSTTNTPKSLLCEDMKRILGQNMTQNASAIRLLQIHTATQDTFLKTLCDTFTVIYFPVILIHVLSISSESL